jgi:hypothetical protein
LLVSSTSSSKCNSFFQRDEGEHMRQRCIWKAKCIKLFDVMPVHAIETCVKEMILKILCED